MITFIKKKILSICKYFGYELKVIAKYSVSRPIQPDNILKEHLEIINKNTMVNYEGLISLYDQVKYIEENNIIGDFVECGVWKGGCVGLMALANKRFGRKYRKLHLFDSFQGIPEPVEGIDGDLALNQANEWSDGGKTGRMRPLPGFYDNYGGVGTLQDNKDLLEKIIGFPRKHIQYHSGWFNETIPPNKIESIALLRLDSDWYESTKICLDSLVSKVVENGFIIIDDYGTYDGCKKAVDEYFSNRYYFHRVNQDIIYLVKKS